MKPKHTRVLAGTAAEYRVLFADFAELTCKFLQTANFYTIR
jgi:hypothetical protein